MYFSWQFPNKDNFKDILLKYYLFYEQYLGKNILSSITKKNINKGIFNNTILFMDENYKLACETIYSIFMDKNIKFLIIYDLNNNVIACSRVKLSIENYPNNAIVGEVLLSSFIDDIDKEYYYLQIIKYIENNIINNYEQIQTLTFEVPQTNWVFFDVCKECGYNLLNESNKDYSITFTYLFDKNIRKIERKKTV